MPFPGRCFFVKGNFFLRGSDILFLWQSNAFLHIFCKEGGAAGDEIAVGGFEVAGVPGIGNVTVDAGKGEEEADARGIGLTADDVSEKADITLVHTDEEIVAIIVSASDTTGMVIFEGNTMCLEGALGRGVDGITNHIVRDGGGVDDELVFTALAAHELLHDELSHGAAADVAVTEKKNGGHSGWVIWADRVSARW